MHGPPADITPLGDLLVYIGLGLLILLGTLALWAPRWFRHRPDRPVA